MKKIRRKLNAKLFVFDLVIVKVNTLKRIKCPLLSYKCLSTLISYLYELFKPSEDGLHCLFERSKRVIACYLLHVYLNKCEFYFLLLHINKTNIFCVLISNGRALSMTK